MDTYNSKTEITYKKKKQTIGEWEKELGLRKGLLAQRLRQGMTLSKAFTMPVKNIRPYKKVGDRTYKVKKTGMEKRLAPEELKRFLACFTYENFGQNFMRNKAICQFLLNTGLRLSELRGLEIQDVRDIQGYKDYMDVRAEIVKGKKTSRQIKLNDAAQEALDVLVNVNKSCNFTDKIVTLSVRQIRQIIENASIRAGLPRIFTPHCLRHTFLSTIYQKTKDVAITKTLAGHRSAATTMNIYVNPTWEDMGKSVDDLYSKKD